MRNAADRLRHAIGYEVFGIILSTPLASLVMETPMLDMGALTVFMSITAMLWNIVYNHSYDKFLLRYRGRVHKTWSERGEHAIGFELGLSFITIPVAAWWLSIGWWEALCLDIAFLLFYVVFAFFYNLAYDKIFPLPAPPPPQE